MTTILLIIIVVILLLFLAGRLLEDFAEAIGVIGGAIVFIAVAIVKGITHVTKKLILTITAEKKNKKGGAIWRQKPLE